MAPASENDSCSAPSVIIIGGGIAGLAAARALHKSSFKVTVLESRARLGGRIHTDYSFGFPVDMGASWLHGVSKDNPLASLIGRLGLPLYRTSGDNSVLYDHDLESYALFDTDGGQVPPSLVFQVGETFEAVLETTKKLREEFPEDMSVYKALSMVLERRPELELEGLAAKVLQWYLCRLEGWFGSDADQISVRCWDEEDVLEGGHGLMVKGYFPVIASLADGLDIRLNHKVVHVNRQENSVQVITQDSKVFEADAVVIAAPLGVLKAKTIQFEPRLPDWKEEAIDNIGLGNENKIALCFDQVFWPNVEFLGVVASTTYSCSYFLNLHKATGHPVLVYMPAGRLADDIQKLTDEEAVSFAFDQLKRILPSASSPVKFLVSRWGSDENSLGCYSFDMVGRNHNLYEQLRSPVDEVLFFAGEATSQNFPGTVHGAFSTGVLAAAECRKSLAQQGKFVELFQPAMAEEVAADIRPLKISRL